MKPTTVLLSRSVWKDTGDPNSQPSFSQPCSLPIVRPKAGERVPPIKTQARSATILPNFVGLIFQVHNGKIYNDVRITEDMVGHKLGEFSATRKRFNYKQTKNK
ncbi:mitochondrial ribosomal small subunit component [Elasticomyces elasticus]|nr:mitochondrial ribosomal small subunit component [Elasticomyces elasticus]KAK3647161.1 mitochondrial ribosomal small subunit component [Elasticomyces elasticus]KAK4918597.1 mitochondrial ribosomal small subunit component [Elasticomyces elasticus]KAK5756117.1 mitochondrial ribosomal small subunit component [Elasticomyces elasticus]